MTVISDKSKDFHDPAMSTSNDAHCQRVARLASNIGHQLGFNSKCVHILSNAAIQHHSMELLEPQKELLKRDLGNYEKCEPLNCLEILEVFHGMKEPSPNSLTALLTEILHLANAFDEKFEWRIFEASPGSEIIQEMEVLMHSGLWSEPVHKAFFATFAESRNRALAKAQSLPLSTVSKIQKLALSSADELTVYQLERLALADPVLSVDLLRHVNSAKYSPTDRISSVRQAIAYIGTTVSREVMLASAARGIFASSSLHRLWKHSIGCANTMSALAIQAKLDPHQAFLLGLLHDIGRISLACFDSKARSSYTHLSKAEVPAIWIDMITAGCDHAELGADILAEWNFPESITESVRHHHSPELSEEKLTSLLYLVESTEGDNEDIVSPGQFADALSKIQMSQDQFNRVLTGKVLVALAC